jgi:hypothetical protein
MSTYLTANELADLIGCQPNSRACMKRWLTKNGWPFAENVIGVPIVSRAYHDARMTGADPAASEQDTIVEPDFTWSKK